MSEKLFCKECQTTDLKHYSFYKTKSNGERELLKCMSCGAIFSETKNTAMAGIRTEISKIAGVIKVRSEGMGLRATGRIFGIQKKTVSEWEAKFVNIKETLKLYLFCHEFVKLTFEGDEIYTRINKNRPASESEGWTAILMERSSRFILESKCGRKEEKLFLAVIKELARIAMETDDLTLFTDGERRYSQLLFNLCSDWITMGALRKPKKVLKKGIRVRLKNKGGKAKKKYETPLAEHPKTTGVDDKEIHANHLEAKNASIRRRNSAFKRKTNTYAKNTKGLQRTLDVDYIIHNFSRPHFTTGEVPAVAIGIITNGFSIENILRMPKVA